MDTGEDLYRLQQLDSERDEKQRRLAEIQAVLEDDKALRAARKNVETAEKRGRKWQTKQRDLELEIESLSEKTSRSEKRLYGGKVQNPKELADLQAEISSLKRRRQSMEETLLDAMINREEAEDALDTATAHLRDLEARRAAQHEDLKAERDVLHQRLETLEQKRGQVVSRIDPRTLDTYERIRELKGGQAVAQIRGDGCSACGVTVAPSMVWRLREGEMIQCDTCRRLLVLRES